jgi:hypothetical protein
LATLEMVLALPLLLFFMALMINFGTLACWKVRGLSIARMAVWGNRFQRSNAGNPQPTYWPPQVPLPTGPTNLPEQVDDSRVDQPVARGPQIMNAQVNTALLDPTRGLLQGSASLTRNWPMMGKWPAYQLQAATCLVDDQWQYNTALMGMTSNSTRRIPIIYTLPQAPANLANLYIQAIQAILNAPCQQQLAMLNPYYGYATLNQFCSSNRSDAQQPVQNLIDHIQGKPMPHVAGIPEDMTRSYISIYRSQLHNASNAQASTLQTWISELTQFLATLMSG